MPSTFAHWSPDEDASRSHGSRRRFLQVLGAGAAATTAGCLSGLPGTGPETLSTEQFEDSGRRIAWRYPAQDGEDAGIGYAALSHERNLPAEEPTAAAFEFNSTVANLGTDDAHDGYVADWFRARFRTPEPYRTDHGPVEMMAEPPGAWEGFHTYYDQRGGIREFVVELRDVDTEGTIIVPFVLWATTDPLPTELHCSFTVQATKKGLPGRTVRASDGGTLAFGEVE